MSAGHGDYYIPEPSPWPIITMAGILTLLFGTALFIHDIGAGGIFMVAGLAIIAYIFYGWFRDVIGENLAGRYNEQVDRSFRLGMMWFIASEVFFFLTFFGSLYYIREIAVPWLGGEGYLGATKAFLNAGFDAMWPTNGPANTGGDFEAMKPGGIPALNTAILLTSGATITWAHWGLKKQSQGHLVWGMIATVALGITFLCMQAYEYGHAYEHMNLTLKSGVYGATFYMLTGFHGFHVTMGTIMLIAITGRCMKHHFTPHNHFAFEGVAWYWHFVDVVWLGLYIFVYWL